ncbi:MAG: hypothetical protein AAF985_10135 [Bacteroidota bacterium]
MDLQILISKKGTKVVTATNLHSVLALPAHKYNSHVEKWLGDYYAFKDDIRQPLALRDYAERTMKHSRQKDYYLSLELAGLITLNTESAVKQKYAKWLLTQIKADKEEQQMLTKEQILAVLELTKVMGLISCQQSVERQHQKHFEKGQTYNRQWWQYRASLLGYSVGELKEKMAEIGKSYKNKSALKLLVHLDKYEIIRMAVIDLFIALGKPKKYAQGMGDLAKIFAREIKVEIWDDREASINFNQSNIDMSLVNDVKSLRKNGILSLWQ